jgi:hypothetical protein
MLSPLTGLVDAAQADSQAARQFAKLVDQLLSDAPTLIPRLFARYSANGETLHRAEVNYRTRPALHETKPLADDLSDIAAMGWKLLAISRTGSVPTAQWRDAKLVRLDQAGKPKAALEFANIRSVKLLVIAAAEITVTASIVTG